MADASPKPKSIFSYLRPHRRALALGVLLLLATNALDKAIPWLLYYALDALRQGHLSDVGRYAIGVIGLAAVMWVVRTFSRITIFNIGRDVEYDLRNELLDRIHLLGSAFFRRMSTGEIMSRADERPDPGAAPGRLRRAQRRQLRSSPSAERGRADAHDLADAHALRADAVPAPRARHARLQPPIYGR